MGEEPREIEEHIRRERDALDRDITELEERYRQATDWRQQVGKRPGVILALAFGVGLVGALVLPSGKSSDSRDPHPQDWDERSRRRNPSNGWIGGAGLNLLHGFQAALVSAITHQIKEHFSRKS